MEASMFRKGIALLLCVVLMSCLLVGCAQPAANGEESAVFAPGYGIRAAVVYSGGESWLDTLHLLEQSPMLGLSVEGLRAGEAELDGYDVLYLDESLLETAPESFFTDVAEYTRAGGAVFLPNGFVHAFPGEYLGISAVEKIDGCLTEPEYPRCDGDESALQQIVRDFSDLYTRYADFSVLRQHDYGWGVKTADALPLVKWNGLTVYALHSYGEGTVLFTNPLLPSAYSTGRLSMELEEGDSAYASTTASFNQLLLCGFAEYIAKQTYGFALERSYGYFGTPSMAWELHYEEITGIANGSMQIFSELCESYDQIPSFTLIRNSYRWFQRSESVTYLINQAAEGSDFAMDYHESAYSSGTHVDAGGQWLSLASVENAGSYFLDYPEFTNRAYPQAADFDGDGYTDILCGSMDGCVYYFKGLGYENGRLRVAEAECLTDADGAVIDFGYYSAPRFYDVDGDGTLDLVCGWSDGGVRWFSGGSGGYTPRGMLLQSDVRGQALPELADLNGDGVAELILGSDKGILMVYSGSRGADGVLSYSHFEAMSLSKLCANAGLGGWLAPAAADYNGDGVTDLALGVYDGYVALLLGQLGGGYAFGGYVTAEEKNYKGNNNLKFGNFAAPCFVDLNGDGSADLICGSQEYGMAYPIDSGYFPYEQELREQVAYADAHDYYMGVHFYTNAYASPEREAYELQAHKDAFAYYGLDTEKVGVNQHTWYTSRLGGAQTMASIYDAGLYWQSGFAAPGAAAGTPQAAAENVVSLPFFLMENGERTTLVQNNATLMYGDPAWYAISARYRMPVCIYYHCDFAYESDDPTHASLRTVQGFRETYGYNFNREDQLMLASAAALHQSVEAEGSLAEELALRSGDPSGEYDLYDAAVYASLGARMVLSDRVNTDALRVDADVWYRDGNNIILGLNREVRVYAGSDVEDTPHIRRINMAANVTVTETGAAVEFLSGGMMELAVEGEAATDDPGWKVISRGDETIFIKFGGGETLHLVFQED